MAVPRLTGFDPVILSFRASKPPGVSRFLATCIAAMHCPRFLKPEHAVFRLPPGTEIPLFDRALVSELSSLLLLSTVAGDCEPMLEWLIPVEPTSLGRPVSPEPTPEGTPVEPGPAPAGRPAPAPPAPCWAKTERLKTSITAKVRYQLKKLFFIPSPPVSRSRHRRF